MCNKNFVSPHVHIKSFDAASTVEKFAKRELALGTGYLTVTDHGTLEASRQVYDICKNHKDFKTLKPIIGLEGYFRDDDCSILKARGIEKDDKGGYKEYLKYTHITLHFLDQEAFRAGSRILSNADLRAETHGSERKPLFGWADLEELGGYNVTMTSGCLIGMVGRHLLKNKDPETAIAYYEKLRSIPKAGNFYVEVFPHVCDRDYQVAIYFQYEDGTEDKFPTWKSIKTSAGEFKAEQISIEFDSKRAQAEARHLRIMEVMNYRKWEPVVDGKRIVNVVKREGFLQNECSPMAPDGDVQKAANLLLIGLAQKYGDKVLISDDAHFATPDEKVLQDIRLNQRESERGLSASWIFPNSHHRLSSNDARSYFASKMPSILPAQVDEWIENSHEWAAKFDNFAFDSEKSLPTSFFPSDTLGHLMTLIEKNGRMDWSSQERVQRLESEVSLLKEKAAKDLLPYFFGAEELCDWYLRNGQLPGPGRGSAAGLLTAYLLRITHKDPLPYNLSQDRFMTPERAESGKWPDIDQDLPGRELIEGPDGWLKKRFGDCVAQISTEHTLKLKSSIKDTFRALHGRVGPDIEAFCKSLPNPPQGISDNDFLNGYDSNGEWVPGLIETSAALRDFSEQYKKEWAIIKDLIGLVRQRSRHACAFVIADTPIQNLMPLTTIGGHRVTQFDHAGVEAAGGLKMDYLNLNSLRDLQAAIRLVQDRSGTSIDWASARKLNDIAPSMTINGKKVPYVMVIPHNGHFYDVYDLPDDPGVYSDICEGKTESIFQFNTAFARGWLGHFNHNKPNGNKLLDSLESLAVFTALGRPGPIDAFVKGADGKEHNMLVEFANRARGLTPCGNIPYLDKTLPETHGIIVYQEQLERMFKELGKTTASKAEEFRRAVAKKDMKKVLGFKTVFMAGALPELGEKTANELWDSFVTFGQYGFNKSHAICYVTISYACAYLKRHFPLEWWTAVLRNAKREEVETDFWPYCGYLIDTPSVANASHQFEIVKNRIKAPLSLLRGIGDKAHEQLAQYAPYKDIRDFCEKIQKHKESNATESVVTAIDKKTGLLKRTTKRKLGRSALNTKIVNTLIVTGAMDDLFSGLKTMSEKILEFQDVMFEVSGKNITKKARQELIERYQNLTDLQCWQIRKELLPSLTDSLLPILASNPQFRITKVGSDYVYQASPALSTKVFGSDLILAMRSESVPLPMGGIEATAIGYVLSDRRFTYGSGTKKTAAELTLDVEGERVKLVQWPNDKNKLPPAFEMNSSLDGCIVAAQLQKKINQDIKLKTLHIIEHRVSLGSIEETPEESSQ